MFTHVQVWHIAFNMLALWVLGPQMELATGRARFLALYLLSGMAGSTAGLLGVTGVQATLGASGAIFGLMGALLVVVLKVGGDVRSVLMWIGINFVVTFLWRGHLLAGPPRRIHRRRRDRGDHRLRPRKRRTLWQVLGLTAYSALLVVAIVLRTLQLA